MRAPKTSLSILVSSCFALSASVQINVAATKTAASASYADVSAAVSAASPGDTIIVPAGNATWNARLEITKGLTIIGAGSDSTVIVSNYRSVNGSFFSEANFLVTYKPAVPANDEPFRLSGIGFDLAQKCSGLMIENESTVPITRVRIDHCSFTKSNFKTLTIHGTVYGVADNNEMTVGNGGSGVMHFYGLDAESWSTLTLSFGAASNFYFEDNVITIAGDSSGHGAGRGGRYCSRYNTWIYTYSGSLSPWFDLHGNMGASRGHGTMGAEIYGNLVTSTHNAGVKLLDQRGGKVLCFWNNANNVGANTAYAREEYDDSENPPAMAPDGQPQHVANTYFWNNRKNNTKLFHLDDSENDSGVEHPIVENQDFWKQNPSYNGIAEIGMYCGSSLPAKCTVGDGAWITAQDCSSVSPENIGAHPQVPISGALYKCTAPNTWTAYYTPYTYPHPLRSGDTDTTPEPPTNIRFVQ